jgi:hypothetical protein
MTGRYSRQTVKYKRLTQRDKQIIEAVFTARYLSTSMVQSLFFTSSTRTKTRLRVLFNQGYLLKREVGERSEDVYYLGVKGRHLIEDMLSLERDYVTKVAGVSGQGNLYLDHELTLSRLYVSGRKQAKLQGWQFDWCNTRMLRLARLGVQPDAHLKIRGERDVREAFIEFTDVLPKAVEMERKLEGYQALWANLRPIPILWFCSSRVKARRIRDGVRGCEAILVGDISQSSQYLTEAIWWWGQSKEAVAFLRPKETVLYRAGGR